jgi:hypothetical protein
MQLVLGFDGDSDDAAAQFHEDFRICKFLPILSAISGDRESKSSSPRPQTIKVPAMMS